MDRAEGVHRARVAGKEDALADGPREDLPAVRESRARGGVRPTRPAVADPAGGRAAADPRPKLRTEDLDDLIAGGRLESALSFEIPRVVAAEIGEQQLVARAVAR